MEWGGGRRKNPLPGRCPHSRRGGRYFTVASVGILEQPSPAQDMPGLPILLPLAESKCSRGTINVNASIMLKHFIELLDILFLMYSRKILGDYCWSYFLYFQRCFQTYYFPCKKINEGLFCFLKGFNNVKLHVSFPFPLRVCVLRFH